MSEQPNDDDKWVQLAHEVDRKRVRNAMWAAVFGAILAVVILVIVGGAVWFQLRDQNETLERAIAALDMQNERIHEAVATAQDVSEGNQEILRQQVRQQRRELTSRNRQARQEARQLRRMRQEHNALIRLIRGVIRAAGRGDLLEGLPGRIGGGGAGRGDNPPGQPRP